ncbi:retropepsin-like aspartic protease [Flavobacterium suncheonense]|uniref:Acid protease n=1 Tax=Flavobacterium suncheonense GH29-5 = DSM 17707 TaxID=1121899 RepID=A0A0A2MDS5_9FLAO|nr:retropepsin-like aspartic protease [Flavobacterium suncheonense]KGO90439.1 acid protease [Flavobacterium suncheonense GH29-5 = DSM 17707]
MEHLHDILKKKGYKKIKFKLSKTQHLLIKAKINGVTGNFILDTGASNSCIGFESVAFFNLTAQDSPTKAAGAGATGMYTQMATDNTLQLSRWKSEQFQLIIFDMSHVNLALKQYKAKPVHGIIGADILLKGKAVIDYYHHYLYLK